MGVRISLIDRVSTGLMGLARNFAKVHGNAKALQTQLDKIKLTLAGGAIVTGAGILGLAALRPAVKEAEKFQTLVANFRTYGLGEKLNRDAADFAKNMNVAGSSFTQNMKLINEAQGVFRESGMAGPAALRGARLAAPMLARMDFANVALDPESQGRMHAQNLSALRFAEMRGGVNDPAKFNAILNSGFKAIRSSGGAVDFEQLRQFAARAGIAGQGLSNEALFGKLEPAIVELKGSTAGTSLMTAYNRINGLIKVPNQVKDEYLRLGIWDRSKVTTNSLGGVKSISGNPMKDAGLFARDPVAYYEKNIMPLYAGLSQAERARQNALLFGRTGGNLFTLIDRQLPAIHHSVEAQRKAMDIAGAAGAAGNTVAGRRQIARAAWADVKELAGESLLPLIAAGLKAMVPPLKALAQAFKDHPKLMGGLVVAFAGLAAAMAFVVGPALLIAGAIGAIGLAAPILAGVLGAVGAAFAAVSLPVWLTIAAVAALAAGALYLWTHWKTIGPKLKGAWDAIKHAVSAFVTFLIDKAKAIPQAIGAAVNKAAKAHPTTSAMVSGAAAGAAVAGPLGAVVGATAGAVGERLHHRSAYVHSGSSSAPGSSGDVLLDGQKVGKVMWRHQASELARPPVGGAAYDPGMQLTPVGAGAFSI